MAMLNNGKFCPKCGAQINLNDTYCTRCGYSFRGRRIGGKKSSLKTIIIAVVILAIIWAVIRTLTKQPIIPAGLLNLFQNVSKTKAG
jgi:predicted amidophosphoribosyltransferase